MADAPTRSADGLTARSQVAALLLAVAVGLAGLVAGAVLTLAALALLALVGVSLGVAAVVVLSLVLTQGVAFGGTALVYVNRRGLPREFIQARLPSVREGLWVVGGYFLALAGAYAGGLLATLGGLEPASNQVGEIGLENPEVLLLLVPLSVLLIGPGEELLFRGVVQGTIRRRFGAAASVVLASLVFAAIHYPALAGGTGNRLVTIAILFLPSLVFGAAYERTGNVVVPALIHGLYNATLFGVVYLAIRLGQVQQGAAALGLA